jgi:hypothetical protein
VQVASETAVVRGPSPGRLQCPFRAPSSRLRPDTRVDLVLLGQVRKDSDPVQELSPTLAVDLAVGITAMTARPRVASVVPSPQNLRPEASLVLVCALNGAAVLSAGAFFALFFASAPSPGSPPPMRDPPAVARDEEVFAHLACLGSDLITAADVIRWNDPTILELFDLMTAGALQADWSKRLKDMPQGRREHLCAQVAGRTEGRLNEPHQPVASASSSRLR